MNLYYNNRPGELSDLVNCWSKWHKAGSAQLAPGQTEATLSLPLPVAALNLMVEFDTFHVADQSAAQETLQCPRCVRVCLSPPPLTAGTLPMPSSSCLFPRRWSRAVAPSARRRFPTSRHKNLKKHRVEPFPSPYRLSASLSTPIP